MGSLLESYIPLREHDLASVVHFEFLFLKKPSEAVREIWTIKRQDDFIQRKRYLQVFADILLLTAPTYPTLWDTTLRRLYTAHGIWVLRWLVDLLLYIIHTSEDEYWDVSREETLGTKNWAAGIEVIGTVWARASIPSQPTSPLEASDTRLFMILQGCAADPTTHALLIQHATAPTTPLLLRKLLLVIQIRFGSKAVDSLVPLEKWDHLDEDYVDYYKLNKVKPLREVAAWALGVIRDTRAVPTLLDSLRDESPKLQARCAWALGEIRDSCAVKSLRELLEDPTIPDLIEIEVLRALAKLRAVELLIQALQSAYPNVRAGVAWVLGRIGDARAIAPLIQALGDKEDSVRKAAARALGEIGDARAIAPLTEALQDPILCVQKAAKKALAKLPRPDSEK